MKHDKKTEMKHDKKQKRMIVGSNLIKNKNAILMVVVWMVALNTLRFMDIREKEEKVKG